MAHVYPLQGKLMDFLVFLLAKTYLFTLKLWQVLKKIIIDLKMLWLLPEIAAIADTERDGLRRAPPFCDHPLLQSNKA